jgi:hypothetical protein
VAATRCGAREIGAVVALVPVADGSPLALASPKASACLLRRESSSRPSVTPLGVRHLPVAAHLPAPPGLVAAKAPCRRR